jgi:muramoyltetrapeptide carboxypeptidase LdcA involved in peptidoglycan recycling
VKDTSHDNLKGDAKCKEKVQRTAVVFLYHIRCPQCKVKKKAGHSDVTSPVVVLLEVLNHCTVHTPTLTTLTSSSATRTRLAE